MICCRCDRPGLGPRRQSATYPPPGLGRRAPANGVSRRRHVGLRRDGRRSQLRLDRPRRRGHGTSGRDHERKGCIYRRGQPGEVGRPRAFSPLSAAEITRFTQHESRVPLVPRIWGPGIARAPTHEPCVRARRVGRGFVPTAANAAKNGGSSTPAHAQILRDILSFLPAQSSADRI